MKISGEEKNNENNQNTKFTSHLEGLAGLHTNHPMLRIRAYRKSVLPELEKKFVEQHTDE